LEFSDNERSAIGPVVFSHDGKYLASPAPDKTVKLWDISTGKVLRTLKGQTDPPHNAEVSREKKDSEKVHPRAFSPDGKFVGGGFYYDCGGCFDDGVGGRTVRVWAVGSGKEILTLKRSSGGVFSPDGKYLLTMEGSGLPWSPGLAKLWDLATGKELQT